MSNLTNPAKRAFCAFYFKHSLKRIHHPILLLMSMLCCCLVQANTSVQASKTCMGTSCNVTLADPIVIIGTPKTIHWSASYTGSATQGHSFYLTTSPNANLNDIPLTTNGALSGTKVLTAGTYYIAIKLALMGPGTYTVTYNPGSTGEPHITTFDGARYDFQSAGEFIAFRQQKGLELQVRQSPIAVKVDPSNEAATCVSVNSAAAVRVGAHRITYEPNINGVPDPSGMQLRIDGQLTELGETGVDLGDHNRVNRTNVPGGIRIRTRDGNKITLTPAWWASQSKWYMNVDVDPVTEGFGIYGSIPQRSWLPALPDGGSIGPLPVTLHERYIALNQKFADAWRVTDSNSLFDYANGTSTSTFTNRDWPAENPPCELAGITPMEPLSAELARLACQAVKGEENASCVFDVRLTGDPGFATTYVLSQHATDGVGSDTPATTEPRSCWSYGLIGLIIGLLIALLIGLLRRKK